MGALFHIFDLFLHLSGIYLLNTGIWVWYIVIAECVWFLIKLVIRHRTYTCALPHFTELEPQAREELLRNFPGLPPYIYHPDVERAEWLNDIVKRLWTPINRTVQKLCRDQLTDLFNKEIQRKISLNFQFLTVDIGTVPFEVVGVKSYSDNNVRNELCYDVDIVYNGNAHFAFKLGPIRAGLKNFKLRGSLRVVARPILNEPPFIAQLVIYFLSRPTITYEFTNFLNFLNYHTAANVIDETLYQVLNKVIVAPNSYKVDIVKNPSQYDAEVDLPMGYIRIHLISAEELQSTDLQGTCFPMVRFSQGQNIVYSKTATDPLKPTWDEYLQFPVYRIDEKHPVEFHVEDQDPEVKVSLGRGKIELSRIQVSGMLEVFQKLEGVASGFLYMQLEWIELSTDKSDFEYQKDISQKVRTKSKSLLPAAICFVTIQAATNLPSRKDASDPNAKALIKYGTFQDETKVEKNKKNPVWYKTFNVPIYTLDDDTITIDVVDAFDATTTLPMGSVNIQLSNVMKQKNVRLDGAYNFIPTNPLTALNVRVIFRTFRSGEFSMFPDSRPRPPDLTPSASATDLAGKKRKSVPSMNTLSPSKSKLDVSKSTKSKGDKSGLKPQLPGSDSTASAVSSSTLITSTKVVNDSSTVPVVNEKPSDLATSVSVIKPSDSDVGLPLANKVSSSFWGTSSTSTTKQKKEQYFFNIGGHDVNLFQGIPQEKMAAGLNMFARYLGSLSLAGKSSDSPGLVECQEMDKQLAAVASAKLQEIPADLFEEVLFSIEYIKLLPKRQVCKLWMAMISDARQVCINLQFVEPRGWTGFGYDNDHHNVWQYATRATSIVMYDHYQVGQYSGGHSYSSAHEVLDDYQCEAAADGRTVVVSNLIYGHTKVPVSVLEHEVTRRRGFTTVLYQTEIEVDVSQIFFYFSLNETAWAEAFGRSELRTTVSERGSFRITEADMVAFGQSSEDLSPSLLDFVARSIGSLTEVELVNLSSSSKNFILPAELLLVVQALLEKFDKDNKQALKYYKSGDIRRFAETAHPMVPVLLHHYIETVENYDAQAMAYADVGF